MVPSGNFREIITTAFLVFLICAALVLPTGAENATGTTQTTVSATSTAATTIPSTTQTTSPVTSSTTTTVATTQTTVQSTTVATTSQPQVNPVIAFSADNTYGTAPLEVHFSDMSTGGPVSWNWDFGDGGSDTIQNPTHTYHDAGIYTVLMTASSRTGGSGIQTRVDYIEVEPSPTTTVTTTVTTSTVSTGLLGSFTGSPLSGSAPLTVVFTDTSAGNPIAWLWDFGDGGTETTRNPVHTYEEAGTYTVTLVVNSSDIGKTVKQADFITVDSTEDPVQPERTLYGSVGNEYLERTSVVTTVPTPDKNSGQLGAGKTQTPTPTLTGKAWLEYEKKRMAEVDALAATQQKKDFFSEIVSIFKGLFSFIK